MLTRFSFRFAMSAPLVVAMLVAGCESAPGLNKQFGTYYELVEAPIDRVVPAARAGAQDANAQVVSEENSNAKTTLIARNPDDVRVKITMTREAASQTRLGVNVTPGEPEGYSRVILNKIKERLDELPKRPNATDGNSG